MAETITEKKDLTYPKCPRCRSNESVKKYVLHPKKPEEKFFCTFCGGEFIRKSGKIKRLKPVEPSEETKELRRKNKEAREERRRKREDEF